MSSTPATDAEVLRLHAVEPRSFANGPGCRTVVWFQGCALGCPGCFNPATHDEAPFVSCAASSLAARVAATSGIEGVTFSGGEPLQQSEGLLAVLRRLRAETRLSVLLFSGFTLHEIQEQPVGRDILRHVDVLVDGRFVAARRLGRGLRGSANQRVHLLTSRYSETELQAVPEVEILVKTDGRLVVTGFARQS